MDEIGTDRSDGSQEAFRRGGWADGEAEFCCPGTVGNAQGQARTEPELQGAGETVCYSIRP